MFELILLLYSVVVADSYKCSAVLNILMFGLVNMDWYEITAEKILIKLHEILILEELQKWELFFWRVHLFRIHGFLVVAHISITGFYSS